MLSGMTEAIANEVRKVLVQHARLPIDVRLLGDGDDLYASGMTSAASVEVVLAIEDRFDISFPDDMLGPTLLQSINSIVLAVTSLRSG